MKNCKIRYIVSLVALLLVVSLILVSCGEKDDKNTDDPNAEISKSVEDIVSDKGLLSMDFSFTDRDKDTTYNENDAVKIVFSSDSVSVSGNGASASGSMLTISNEGTYVISGSTSDGRIIVDADKKDKIHIVLNGIALSSLNGPAFYVKSADKVFVTLADNSENSLSDGSNYDFDSVDAKADAAVFSKEDITFNGSGKLKVTGNYKHGIVSKDDLVITGGDYEITAQKVGMCGKDCVKIGGGKIYIDAGSDAIRSNNDTDENCGFVYISSGQLELISENDGIQAESSVKIEGGDIKIKSGGGSENASYNSDGGFNHFWGRPSGSTSSDTESMKGIKADDNIIISGGNFDIDSADDSIHSNGSIAITDGEFGILSGDDGIHADNAIAIGGGKINIEKSYEGIEASSINIEDGDISIVSSDDGLNAAGGNDNSGFGGRPGQGTFASSNAQITINGGYVYINAKGDGIDSNGSLTVNGGIVLVDGPSDNGNGALDYDGSAKITGGVVIALGSSGMAQNFTAAEGQGSILCSFSVQSAGTSFCICDNNGNVIASFTSSKSYQCAVVSAPEIKKGETYSLYVGAAVSDTDKHGYTGSGTKSGGTLVATVKMSDNVYGGGYQTGFGGGQGHGGGMMRP